MIFRKATGGRVDVALADVSRVDQQKVFNRGVVGNRIHLVLHTSHGDVGYFVADPAAGLPPIGGAARRREVAGHEHPRDEFHRVVRRQEARFVQSGTTVHADERHQGSAPRAP